MKRSLLLLLLPVATLLLCFGSWAQDELEMEESEYTDEMKYYEELREEERIKDERLEEELIEINDIPEEDFMDS